MRIRQVIARLAQLLIGKQRYRAWRIAILRRSEMNRQTGRVYEMRVSRYLPVTQPLILCSQIQRSGGTLLTDLLDGHPQCHTHPHELHIGCPDTATWPDLKLEDDADTWFTMLFEKRARDSFWMDYQRRIRKTDEPDRFPFMFWPDLQRAIFEQCVSSKPVRSVRDIFDCYMTAYFNAWLDNQNLYTGEKKYVTGFIPRMSMKESNVEQFFTVYPDGYLLSIIREPKSWYASASRYNQTVYGKLDHALELWRLSAQATVKAKHRFGDRVYMISFDDLLSDTARTLRSLTAYLGIEFVDSLLTPTFNRIPIGPNSSFAMSNSEVSPVPLTRYKDILSSEEINTINRLAFDLYEQVLALKE